MRSVCSVFTEHLQSVHQVFAMCCRVLAVADIRIVVLIIHDFDFENIV